MWKHFFYPVLHFSPRSSIDDVEVPTCAVGKNVCIRARREADAVVHPSLNKPVVTVLWSGLAALAQVKVKPPYVAEKVQRSADDLNMLNDQVIGKWNLSSLMARGYWKKTMAGRVFPGARDIIHIHELSAQSEDRNPIENIWNVLQRTLCSGRTLPPSIQDLGET